MTSGNDDKADGPARALLVMLAEVNSQMMTLRDMLDSNPARGAVTRACEPWRYPGGGEWRPEEEYRFEWYVEAETRTGELFCWSLDIIPTPTGWRLERSISKQFDGGAAGVDGLEFEDADFKTFDALLREYPALMTEFLESAKRFDFNV
jgi:hypothetical protein